MGLLSIIRKIKRKEKEMRILMVYASISLFFSFFFFPSLLILSNVRLCVVLSDYFSFSGYGSGLDNSGKTTIVLKINGEDTSVISPTLGFNIKTIKYQKLGCFPSLLF